MSTDSIETSTVAQNTEADTPAPASTAVTAPADEGKMDVDEPVAQESETTSDKKTTDPDAEVKDAKEDKAPADEATTSAPTESADADKPATDSAEKTEPEAKPDVEKPAEDTSAAAPESSTMATEGAAAAAQGTPASDKKARRKSSGVVESKSKKLNKKASKAKILHLDAKPGDHFFAKLKGFPPWPVIICDDSMLPQTMLSTRPVTAARPDGTYREDFADGGKRAAERTYPVMYLSTNEFSWTRNSDLDELDPATVKSLIAPKMRKDLQHAHELAEEQNSLDHYKQMLIEFEEQRLEALEAKNAKAKAKKDKADKAKKVEAAAAEEDEDVEMADAVEADEEPEAKKSKSSKKRKAEEDTSTPQRSDSVKKPKIKLTNNSTPKPSANGVQSPKPAKESSSKLVKVKSKPTKSVKESDGKKADKEPPAPKEPEMTPEERHVRKEKEILFLRHRLQKGLLNREAEPKESEMQPMSDYLNKLESFPDLEVSIIRATKINKVLKAIIKLDWIPKEEELKFKPRSQVLLDKWNKILATETTTPAGPSGPANGVNGTSGEAAASKAKETTNGVNHDGGAEASKDKEEGKPKPEKEEEKEAKVPAESKDESTKQEKAAEKPDEETAAEATTAEVAA